MVCDITYAIQRNDAEIGFYQRVLPPPPADAPMMAGAADKGDENQFVPAAGAPAGGACGTCGGVGHVVVPDVSFGGPSAYRTQPCSCEAGHYASAGGWHYYLRYVLNRSKDFNSLCIDQYSNYNDKTRADQGETISKFFLGENWTLQRSDKSVYHSQNGKGTDCFKWVADKGRELVIRRPVGERPTIEASRELLGTYNFRTSTVGHIIWDVIPYYFYGNGPYDTTPIYDRIKPGAMDWFTRVISENPVLP